MDKRLKSIFPLLVFLGAVIIFGLMFYLLRAFMTSMDEYDQIAVGYLMFQGRKLYADIFTTHFPLPYWWVSLFANFWINESPSRAMATFRLSLAILYLLSFFLIFVSFRDRRSKFSFSVWILFAAIFASLYHGNLLLSETFMGIFVSCLFWLSIPIVFGWEKVNHFKLLLTCLFSSAAFWTQPLLFPLLFVPFLFKGSRKLVLFYLLVFLGTPVLLLFLNGNLNEFIEQAILFNKNIYSRFFPEQINSYTIWQQTILSIIFNEKIFLTSFIGNIGFSQFIAHVGFLVFLIVAFKIGFKRGGWRYVILLLALALAVRVREIKVTPGNLFNFGIYPLMLVSVASTILLVFQNSKYLTIFGLALSILFFGISIKMVDPIIKQSLKPGYNYHVFWSYRQENGDILNKLSCQGEKILVYPHDIDLYYFARREPIDRFTYWFPWINSVEKYRNERLRALKEAPPVLIYLGNLNYRDTPGLYVQYFPGLTDGYRQIAKGEKPTNIWIKNEFAKRVFGELKLIPVDKLGVE